MAGDIPYRFLGERSILNPQLNLVRVLPSDDLGEAAAQCVVKVWGWQGSQQAEASDVVTFCTPNLGNFRSNPPPLIALFSTTSIIIPILQMG